MSPKKQMLLTFMDRLSGHDWSNIVGIPLDVPDYNGGSELY
jgi:hypothetical protein